ncbi:hypothetical protein [Streptomyces sp. 3211]|uniref:hypothetical protein n=1 Tax=Streptomyces sp. 3211 TaxID=1964449 RepID=UPI001331A97A|nr:hypothetical protein [Streptomyces sp. 3211]
MSRRHLDRMWRSIGEELSSSASRAIYTQRSITRIEAASPGQLADVLEESTEPGNPELLDNMWITAHDPRTESRAARDIVLVVTDQNVLQCTLTGDPTWVRGRSAALRSLAEEVRPLKWRLWYLPPLSYAAACMSLGGVVNILASNLIPDNTFSATWSIATSIAIVVFFALTGWVFGKAMSRKCRAEIWLKREELPQKWFRISAGEAMMGLVGVVALLVTAIFGLVTHSDANKTEKETSKPSPTSSP